MSIKIQRAAQISSIGNNLATFSGLLAHIPSTLIQSMTSCHLAETIDALYACAQESKALRTREEIQEGVIWDANQNRSREIAA